MKKLLFSLFALLALAPFAHAGECNTITDVNDYWVKVKSGVNIRDQVCEGKVIGTLSAGALVKVTGEIEGWRYIERPDGGVGFIWSDFVENTSAPVQEQPNVSTTEKEALYDIVGHEYEQAIRYLADKQIVQGYPDKTYQADWDMKRGEFIKIVVGAKLGYEPVDSARACFPDFVNKDWHWSWVCYAKDNNIVKGFGDGQFKATEKIRLTEAAKILANTLALEPEQETDIWYQVYLEALQSNNYIPDSFSAVDQFVNRGQMAEMVWRILEQIKDQPAKNFSFEKSTIDAKTLTCADQVMPDNVDMNQVRQAWFDWVNAARAENGLQAYEENAVLNATAQVWSESSAYADTLTHQRDGQTEYYDYQLITKWFEDLGVTFKNVGGWTYSENIGRTYLTCNKDDCTQELIDGTKLIFDAYMAEKGTANDAHYQSVMSPSFKIMGVAWSDIGEEIYVTIHYAAELEQQPNLSCN